VALLVAVGVWVWRLPEEESVGNSALPGHCAITGSDLTVTTEQAANAATIAAVARLRGLPERAAVIALATAQQESRLRNLDYGDRDSLGLFQQRPSQGWGSEAQVQDPVYAAGKFFDHLVTVPGWDTGDLTTVADAVQRSAFPLAYRQWSGMAETLAAALLSDQPARITCNYSPPDGSGTADQQAKVLQAAGREAGPAELRSDGTVTVSTGDWPTAYWAVTSAERLSITSVRFAGWWWTPDGGWESGHVGPDSVTVVVGG